MPTEKNPPPESLKEKLHGILVRIPVHEETITAAMLLIQQLIALAIVLKVPLKVEKVVNVEIEDLAMPSVEDVAKVLNVPMQPVTEGEK